MEIREIPKRRPVPERPVIIQSGELCLEGLYISKKKETLPVLLNSPHPQFGGSMDNAFLNETAFVLASLEITSLRYNYRGVGASQGSYGEGDGEEADMAAASDFLLESVFEGEPGSFTCMGYSFGSWMGYRRALKDTRIKRLLLVAPPIKKYDFSDLAKISTRLGIIIGSNDHLCSPEELNSFLNELKKKNPRWQAPEVYEVPEATHYFVRGLAEAGRMAGGFLSTGRFVNPITSNDPSLE